MEKNTSVIIAWIVTGVVVLVFGVITTVVLIFGARPGGPSIGPDGQVTQEGITASGQGTIEATPDEGQVMLGVETRDSDATKASQQNAAKATKIIDAIKKLGIKESDIQTINLSVTPEYDYTSTTGSPKVTGYVASNTVEIKTKETSKLPAIVDAGLAAGANQLQGATFSFSDETQKKLEEQAREKAIADARQKAEKIAAGSGVSLGKLVSSVETSTPEFPPIIAYAAESKGGGDTATTPIEPGSSEVTITVTVTYEIK